MGIYPVSVVGESFRNTDGSERQVYIAGLDAGDRIELRADPFNPHDELAVEVHCAAGQIGHVGRADSWLQERVHRGAAAEACVLRVNRGLDAAGVVLLVATGGEDLAKALALAEANEDAELDALIAELGMDRNARPAQAAQGCSIAGVGLLLPLLAGAGWWIG